MQSEETVTIRWTKYTDAKALKATASLIKKRDKGDKEGEKKNEDKEAEEGGGVKKAVEVVTGLSDSQFTEMMEGDLKKGDVLVTGIKPAEYGAAK